MASAQDDTDRQILSAARSEPGTAFAPVLKGSPRPTTMTSDDACSPPAQPARNVRFEAQPITAIWAADSSSDYDRRSIVVDLSKTPFALLRKDSVLMKQSSVADMSAPLPRPSPPTQDRSTQQQQSGAARAIASPARSSEHKTPVAGVWDSDASDSSSGHTDNETDMDQSESSDMDSCYDSCCDQPRVAKQPRFSGTGPDDMVMDSDSSTDVEQPCLDQLERRGSLEATGPAFYGVWKRTSCEGYEELLRSSGVPRRAAALALAKHPVHIIDHDGAYFRLIVKNGLSKVDDTFFIGEQRVDKIGKENYDVCLNWGHIAGTGTKDELTLTSVCRETGEEVIAIRSLEDGGNRMVLTQIVRRPAKQYEVKAKHFFKRVTDKAELRSTRRGPSSNVVTERQPKSRAC